jgi:hypothetical protein
MSAKEMKYNYRSDTVAFEVILLCVFPFVYGML